MSLHLLVSNARVAEATALSLRVGLPLEFYAEGLLREHVAALPPAAVALVLESSGLGLYAQEMPAAGAVRVEADAGPLGFRLAQERVRHEQIVKACGLQKQPGLRIFDATAGLLRDAAVLAAAGAEVTVAERSKVIAALIEDGLRRAPADSLLARLCFRAGDSLQLMREWPDAQASPDVVCLDPMFPHREKSALVKKEMRVFREVVGEDTDADALLAPALALARRRVVVKRPRLAPCLADRPPTFVVEGRAGRFDVYQTG
ncbi:MAG: class I SAM-dependent methyltransferase [Moraxellaceae bacterium]|nr:class I SAM-dependent methyltransferase [Moraxellaceae bacterium]